MTEKSHANAAHDGARAEDARRAHAELHEYITSLERTIDEMRESVALSDDRAKSRQRTVDDLAYRCARAEGDRDAARLAIRTIRDALRCSPGEDPAELAASLVHRAEAADHARATLDEHLANAERRLSEVTRERDEARRAAEHEHREHETTLAQLAEAQRALNETTHERNAARLQRDEAIAALTGWVYR